MLMTRKIFFICLTILLCMTGTTSAEDNGLPESNRIKVAVEISNSSRYKELPTGNYLEIFLNDKLPAKNLVNIVDMKVSDHNNDLPDGLILDEDRPVDAPTPAQNIGDLFVFDAAELIKPDKTVSDFDQSGYQALGAAYVIRCEILALGTSKVEDNTIGMIMGIIGGGLSLGGSGGNSDRDKTLRRVGAAIGLGGFIQTKRTALNTVVNMKFISVESGEVLWQDNFIGQAVKHRKPSDGYANEWEQAYIESVENAAKRISQRVNKYVDKVIIKGKHDKSFR